MYLYFHTFSWTETYAEKESCELKIFPKWFKFSPNSPDFVFYVSQPVWEAASLPAAGTVGFFPWAEQDMENGLFCGGVYGVPLVNEPESLRREMIACGKTQTC